MLAVSASCAAADTAAAAAAANAPFLFLFICLLQVLFEVSQRCVFRDSFLGSRLWSCSHFATAGFVAAAGAASDVVAL